MRLRGLVTAAALLVLGACDGNDGERVSGGGDCKGIPVVEIAGHEATLATSCAEPFEFRGRRYWGSCFALHPSRVGSLVETGLSVRSEYGGRTYTGVRRIEGVPLAQAFLPESDDPECRPKRVPSYVAIAEHAPDLREIFKRALPRCATNTEKGEAVVKTSIAPCEVFGDEEPHLTLRNVGDIRFAYGTPFKLERKVDGAWRWINRHQSWDLPLFHLPAGVRGRPEPIGIWTSPSPTELKPGLHRVTKELSLRNVGGPVLKVRAYFRVID